MSRNQGGKKSNPLLSTQRAERTRKILIQVGVAAVLVGLIAAIGVSVAVKKARRDAPGPTPTIAATFDGISASLAENGAIRIGKPDAKVTVRVIEDLQCPACKLFEQSNGQVLIDAVNDGTAVVEYNTITFLDPQSGNEYSSRAGNASYCVAEADPSKYQQWLTTMFEQQPLEGTAGQSDDQLIEIAESVGYAKDAVAQCISDRTYDKYIKARTADVANSIGLSTPTVLVDGKKVDLEIMVPRSLEPVISAAAAS